MKTSKVMIGIGLMLIIVGCNRDKDATAMMENPETRTEIFNAITGNHNYMMGIMEAMQSNDHAMQMMQGNQDMMSHMVAGGGMQMMMNDNTMMTGMMENMMNNGGMMAHMMQMMYQQGMMSEDCMQSAMNMMKEKGMDMTANGDDHSDHH